MDVFLCFLGMNHLRSWKIKESDFLSLCWQRPTAKGHLSARLWQRARTGYITKKHALSTNKLHTWVNQSATQTDPEKQDFTWDTADTVFKSQKFNEWNLNLSMICICLVLNLKPNVLMLLKDHCQVHGNTSNESNLIIKNAKPERTWPSFIYVISVVIFFPMVFMACAWGNTEGWQEEGATLHATVSTLCDLASVWERCNSPRGTRAARLLAGKAFVKRESFKGRMRVRATCYLVAQKLILPPLKETRTNKRLEHESFTCPGRGIHCSGGGLSLSRVRVTR